MLKRTQKFFAAPAGVSLGHWTATWCSNTLFLASHTANPEKEHQTQRTEEKSSHTFQTATTAFSGRLSLLNATAWRCCSAQCRVYFGTKLEIQGLNLPPQETKRGDSGGPELWDQDALLGRISPASRGSRSFPTCVPPADRTAVAGDFNGPTAV